MADLKVRKLNDAVVRALKARAEAKGVSLEEEIRRTLTDSVALKREALARRAAASRAATRPPKGVSASDSTAIIREERDAWG